MGCCDFSTLIIIKRHVWLCALNPKHYCVYFEKGGSLSGLNHRLYIGVSSTSNKDYCQYGTYILDTIQDFLCELGMKPHTVFPHIVSEETILL